MGTRNDITDPSRRTQVIPRPADQHLHAVARFLAPRCTIWRGGGQDLQAVAHQALQAVRPAPAALAEADVDSG